MAVRYQRRSSILTMTIRRIDVTATGPVPTVWQVLASLQDGSLALRDAHRLIRAHMRAARRQRVTRKSKGKTCP